MSQQHVAVGKYEDGEDMVNGELTETGRVRLQVSSGVHSDINDALTDSDAPDKLTPAEWIEYLAGKDALDTNDGGRGEEMYRWLSGNRNALKPVKREELIRFNDDSFLKCSPYGKRIRRHVGNMNDFVTYVFDSMQSLEMYVNRIAGRGGNISDDSNPYVMQNLENSRIEAATESFNAGPMKQTICT